MAFPGFLCAEIHPPTLFVVHFFGSFTPSASRQILRFFIFKEKEKDYAHRCSRSSPISSASRNLRRAVTDSLEH
jgi:hypothetical protein